PLQEALRKSSSAFSINLTQKDFQTDTKFDLEFFNLSFKQRIMLFIGFFAAAGILFVYSFTQLIFKFGRPASFAFPYALSNLIFFFSYGFIKGFKTYFKGLFKQDKTKITSFFLISTFLTLYVTFINFSWFLSLGFALLQFIAFFAFMFGCLPEKLSSITSLFSIFV
ncbi:hypothetical protein, partial [Xylella fastidiosa]|uniref:hypothetical protein n=1 Tax=Xylella fastidiosa TaxID=2371 RepID=UPI0012D8770D